MFNFDFDTLMTSVSLVTLAKTLPAFVFMATGAVGGSEEGYKISRSLRFRASNNAYLSRTPAISGNRSVWTWSGWVKRGILGSTQVLFGVYVDSSNYSDIVISNDDTISVINQVLGVTRTVRKTTAALRDPAAHYHIVAACNGSSICSMYINGVQVSSFSQSIGPDTSGWFFNSTAEHTCGKLGSAGLYFDGLMSNVHFVDGLILDASYFGEVDPSTGAWRPKKYQGSFGTNGFHLDFSDNSAATATTIGADRSGNGNNWTPNGISVSPGSTNDSMVDVPTIYGDDSGIGGEVRGNYCTWNPNNKSGNYTLSAGNLSALQTTTNGLVLATFMIPKTGKWYWECIPGAGLGPLGVASEAASLSENFLGSTSNSFSYYGTGKKYTNSVATNYGSTYAATDVIGCAFDSDAGTLTFYKNGVSQGVAFSGLTAANYFPAYGRDVYVSSACVANFGQTPFTYAAPSGFKALCTQNFPDPIIVKPSQYFDVVLASGAGIKSSAEALFAGSDFMEWIKDRANVNNHQVIDTVRGTSAVLQPNTNAAETTYVAPSGSSVAWVWKKGVIPGLDIVLFNKTAGVNEAIAHNLGVAPKMILIKTRFLAASSWWVWHTALAGNEALKLNSTGAKITDSTVWNNSVPNSSNFFIGTGWNASSMLAYVFAEVTGFSRFGKYVGNGSVDGPFVWCGFKPRFIMIKRVTTSAGGWVIHDTARDTFNPTLANLYPHANVSEDTTAGYPIDIISNGFKIRGAPADGTLNASNETYLFCAFAETPFKFSPAN